MAAGIFHRRALSYEMLPMNPAAEGCHLFMHAVPRLLSVATAVPPYPLDQDDVVARVKLLFGRSPDLDRMLPVFLNTGIQTRYSCVPIEWYDHQHGWAERNRRRC